MDGTELPEFAPSRYIYIYIYSHFMHGEIKQGDPLFLYIFILCMERLSMMLEDVTRKKEIQPMTFRG